MFTVNMLNFKRGEPFLTFIELRSTYVPAHALMQSPAIYVYVSQKVLCQLLGNGTAARVFRLWLWISMLVKKEYRSIP